MNDPAGCLSGRIVHVLARAAQHQVSNTRPAKFDGALHLIASEQ